MSISKYIREYLATYFDNNNYIGITVHGLYEEEKLFSKIPTREELEILFEVSGFEIDTSNCFLDCPNMNASPKLPEQIHDSTVYNGNSETFMNCSSLLIPPKLPRAKYNIDVFNNCTALKQAAVFPVGCDYARRMYQNCQSLTAPASVPASVRYVENLYDGCTVMAGEMVFRANPLSSRLADAFKNTTGNIIIYGDKDVCEAVAATANNGNASWAAWYDPEPAVTDRVKGSYTTAADVTRMVRNGALAVATYAPGRMIYNQGDIVRQDEWDALVEAAQTIDPTVTYSTHYENLNKIEAAFDSAL